MRFVLDCLYCIGLLLASPWLLWRRLRATPAAGGDELPATVPAGGVWLHGASVGEVSLIRPLIALLERERPGLPILVSAHTATGLLAARRAYPGHPSFRLPFDWSSRQRRLMARLAPRLLIVVESDLWPNQLLAAEAAGVPVAVVNAKLSPRSLRWHRIFRFVPRALRRARLVAAQTAAHATRFRALGVEPDRVVVTGNMKYDLAADGADLAGRDALRRSLGFAPDDIVIIGGSLHPGEDLDLLAAFMAAGRSRPSRLVIVPRYPDQAGTVIDRVRRAGMAAIARTAVSPTALPGQDARPVIVVDTLGELRTLYAAADIAFVGGSLYYRGSNKGGHNLMEPAILGLPVLFGPHNFSFREMVADLKAADAGIEVADRAALSAALAGLLASDSRRAELGRRARQVVVESQGASARNLALLLPLIDSRASCGAQLEAPQCRHQNESQLLNE